MSHAILNLVARPFLMAASTVLVATAIVLTLTGPFTSSAAAEDRNFANPMHQGNRLDWCFNWSVGCGQQAADAWCAAQGFQRANNFTIAQDIGAATPTRLIGIGAVCDQAFCDGFAQITCTRPSPVTATFNNPIHGGNRLDWCFNWGVGCGQQAANAYCVARGFPRATDFAIAPNIGAATPTRLIGPGAVCDQAFCDGFAHITCGP